jgi:hypothetical protein
MTKIERSIMILRRAHHESKDPAHPLWAHILSVISAAEKHVQDEQERARIMTEHEKLIWRNPFGAP